MSPAGGVWRIVADTLFNATPHPMGNETLKADLVFADPPYNQGIDYGRGGVEDQLPHKDYVAFTRRWLQQARFDCRANGSVVVLISDEWAAHVGWIAQEELGLQLRNWIKWHETFGVQTSGKFARCSRHLFHFIRPEVAATGPARKGRTFNAEAVKVASDRQVLYDDPRAAAGGKVPGDVWEIPRVAGTHRERAAGFPTQVPEALLTRVVLALTDEGDRVREYFTGSGSLARVCVRTARNYEGWEVNATFAELAAMRVREAESEVRREKSSAARKNSAKG